MCMNVQYIITDVLTDVPTELRSIVGALKFSNFDLTESKFRNLVIKECGALGVLLIEKYKTLIKEENEVSKRKRLSAKRK